jgi:DNA-binding NarL/FixJ family response regulator
MTIRVAILDDHISIIDGYLYRLSKNPEIEVVATETYGEALESMLAEHSPDVLILDLNVPTSPANRNIFPIMAIVPQLLERTPGLNILIISMFNQHTLIEAMADAGVSGYILKNDQESIEQLGKIVQNISGGGFYFSPEAYRDSSKIPGTPTLTNRQLEALSLCATYPNEATVSLAHIMDVSGSTLRNLLSGAYLRLGVRTRAAAIDKARQLGYLPVLEQFQAQESPK